MLFLPMQDRMLDADDITVTEEKQEDGSAALVLRIRTSEDSEDAESGQLLIFQDFRSSWNGENVRVVLDGRELEVQKCIATGSELYWSGKD